MYKESSDELSPVEEARRWALCLNQERSFYDYVLDHCEELYSQTPPAFTSYEHEGREMYRAPKYIRWVGKLKVSDGEFLYHLNELKEAYAYALDSRFTGTFPRRFVRYYKNVESITTSTNQAYKSWRVKGLTQPGDLEGLVPMKIVNLDHCERKEIEEAYSRLYHEARELTAIGLDAVVRDTREGLELMVKEKALYDYFKTDHIQARLHTGTQYRARLRHAGESKGERIPLGFIVIDEDSPIKRVDFSLPQAQRPHTLAKLGKELRWPDEISELSYLLFDKSK